MLLYRDWTYNFFELYNIVCAYRLESIFNNASSVTVQKFKVKKIVRKIIKKKIDYKFLNAFLLRISFTPDIFL